MPEDPEPTPQNVPVAPEPPKIDDELATVEEPTQLDSTEPEKPKTADQQKNQSKLHRIKHWLFTHKKYSIPAALALVLIVLATIPATRFKIAGAFYKKDFYITAYDQTAGTPVSGATVTSGAVTVLTDGTGSAKLHLPVGKHSFSFSKKYYQDYQTVAVVPILGQKQKPKVNLIATGRQVRVIMTNIITKKPLSDVSIVVSDITAKTDKDGKATIVLPASLSKASAKLSLAGYNEVTADIQISNTEVKENSFTLTPAGKVYFLSKRTGTLNVMKANVDGTSPEIALAGTGTEQINGTQLSQSADGKYVALITKRTASDQTGQLYIISSADDRLLSVDTGNTNFTIVGWIGDSLVYSLTRNDASAWQTGLGKLKSYSADTGKTTLLDQSSATGDSTKYATESFNFIALAKGAVVYSKIWDGSSGGGSTLLDGKSASLNVIDVGGSNHKILSTYPATDSLQVVQSGANAFDIWHQEYVSGANHYYSYTVGGTVNSQEAMSNEKFYNGSFGYYLSADSSRSLWSDNRDGKYTIIVGDSTSTGTNEIAKLSSYFPKSWFGNDYVLLTLNSSELYIMSASGGDALKITDFQPTTIY